MKTGLNEPKQQRSRAALDRLVSASLELMADGGFDDAPLTEIIKKADYSVGAFYGRFEGKEALFHLVQERFLDDARNWVSARVASHTACRREVPRPEQRRRTARFIVHMIQDFYLRDRGAYRAIFMHTRIRKDERLIGRIHAFNAWCLEQAASLFVLSGTQAQRSAQYRRWALGLQVVSAYLHEKILFGEVIPVGEPASSTDDLSELTRIYVSYLQDNN